MSFRGVVATFTAALGLACGVPSAARAGEPPRSPREVAQALMDDLSAQGPARSTAIESLGRRGRAANCALPALLDLAVVGDETSDQAWHAVAAILPLGGGPWEREVATTAAGPAKAGGRGARWVVAKVVGASAAELDALVAPWLAGPVGARDLFAAEVSVLVLGELAGLTPREKGERSPRVEPDEAARLLVKLEGGPDQRLGFRAAVTLLRDPRLREDVIRRLTVHFTSADPELKAAAIRELGVRGHLPPTLVPELPSMLTSPVPSMREAAARVLAERGPHAAPHVAALGALAQDPDPAVRVAAVAALDRIGLNSPDVPAMLERFASDTDAAVIAELHRAIDARDGVSGRYRNVAMRLLRREAPTRSAEVGAAGSRYERLARVAAIPAGELERIVAYLLDPDPAVADAARQRLEALPSFDPGRHLELLVRAVENPDGDAVRVWAARQLAGTGEPGVDALLSILRTRRGDRELHDALMYAPSAQLEREDVRRQLAPMYLHWYVYWDPDSLGDPRELARRRDAQARFEAVLDRHLDDVRDIARGARSSDATLGARMYLLQRGAPGLMRLAEALAEQVVDRADGSGIRDDVVGLELRFAALERLLTADDPRMRAAACRLLTPDQVDDMTKPLPRNVADALEARLDDDDGRVRGAAAEGLRFEIAGGLSDTALARCVAMLVDRHPAAREATEALLYDERRRLGPHVPTILAQLDRSPDDEARARQLWLLSHPPGPPSDAVVAAWAAGLGSSSSVVVEAALRAIEWTRPIGPATLAQLLPRIEARLASPAHTEAAARALGLYGPRAGPAANAVERAAAAGSKAAAIALPAVQGDAAAWVALLAEDARGGWSSAALRDLRELGPRASAALPTLREALEPKKGGTPLPADRRADVEATIRALEAGGPK